MITAYKLDGTDSAMLASANDLALLGAGWTLNQAECMPAPLPPAPEQVTNAQLRLALVDFGIMPSQISAHIDSMPEGPDKERSYTAWWQTNHIQRDHPMIEQFRVMYQKTPEWVADLFRHAATFQ